MAQTNAKDLINAALALASDGAPSAVLPSARAGEVIASLCDAGDLDTLLASNPNLKELVRQLLDWNGPKATAPSIKAAASVLGVSGEAGRYAHGVEALSFAAVCAPLLEPDRLARLLGSTLSTSGSYRPIMYPASVTAKLQKLLGHYPEQRRETLLISLWHDAHDQRWWDNTANLGRPRRKRRRAQPGEDAAARRDAQAGTLATLSSMSAAELIERLVSGEIMFSPPACETLAATVVPPGSLARLAEVLSEPERHDPDVLVMMSLLGGLAPSQRPASPIPLMVETLEFVLADTEAAQTLPKKPSSWRSLYPPASLKAYPIDADVLAVDGVKQTLSDGTTAHVELIRSPHDLLANKEFMGNCTFSYNARCATGSWVIGKAFAYGQTFNFSMQFQEGRGRWTLNEINSRFNAGNVPAPLRSALETLAAGI